MADKKKLEKRSKQEAKATARGAEGPVATPARSRHGARGKATLPQTRVELLDLHRETRARRNAASHGSAEHVEAIELIGRIEIEIARIERAVDPPLV